MGNYATDYHSVQNRDEKANALRQRQLDAQASLERLRSRTDYVVEPGISGTRDQSMQRLPVEDAQRMTVGERIVRDPDLLKRVIVPTPIKPVPQPKAVSTQPYAPRVQAPMKSVPQTLYVKGLQTGSPVKRWPTSFKKATQQPTSDDGILKGLRNLDSMSANLLGRKGRL